MKYPTIINTRLLSVVLMTFLYINSLNAQSCLLANFSVNQQYDGCTFSFIDFSSEDATTWTWDYGDGTT